MVSKHAAALFLMAAIMLSVIAVAQEFSDPASLTTGRLLANERFTEWDGPKLSNWNVTLDVRKVDVDSEGSAIELAPKQGKDGYVFRRFAESHFRPGDLITFEVDCRAGEADAVLASIRVTGEGNKPLVEVRAAHPGDDQWHTLRVDASFPEGPIERVDILVILDRKATKSAQVSRAEAWLFPRQP